MTLDLTWLEFGLTASAVLLLLFYHLRLAYKVRVAPFTTAIGLTNHARQAWVETVMQEKRDILAVQTLRNWTMAASFLASTAILISLGLVSMTFSSGKLREISHTLNLIGATNEKLLLIKFMALIIDFLFAFLNFSLAIRYFNHVNFMINVPVAEGSPVTLESVVKTLNRGTGHYTLGMRGYYLAIPFTLWLFGALWMLLGAGVLVAVLYRLDRPA